MSGSTDKRDLPSDEILTAFIDGELSVDDEREVLALIESDPRVAERVELLTRANLDFKGAFEPLLNAAPLTSLQGELNALSIPEPEAVAPMRDGGIGRRGLFGLMAASIAAGVITDRFLLAVLSEERHEESAQWRAAVAQYMALYTPDTLGPLSPDRGALEAELAVVNDRLGLQLKPETVALPDAQFQLALVLAYDRRPLAQLLYRDRQGDPLALCIMSAAARAQPVQNERRQGLNIAYWSGRNHSAMLIGHLSTNDLSHLAGGLQDSLFS
ncbi:anti-sigma factor family protein [Oryzifoliimicrobium ureilyticus]|uniref:anti-sigma factor family protein n=1 Tax=Oryzifoliimicrobium ureilyticus TaxID=3113724 RepID=UPI0030765654